MIRWLFMLVKERLDAIVVPPSLRYSDEMMKMREARWRHMRGPFE